MPENTPEGFRESSFLLSDTEPEGLTVQLFQTNNSVVVVLVLVVVTLW